MYMTMLYYAQQIPIDLQSNHLESLENNRNQLLVAKL